MAPWDAFVAARAAVGIGGSTKVAVPEEPFAVVRVIEGSTEGVVSSGTVRAAPEEPLGVARVFGIEGSSEVVVPEVRGTAKAWGAFVVARAGVAPGVRVPGYAVKDPLAAARGFVVAGSVEVVVLGALAVACGLVEPLRGSGPAGFGGSTEFAVFSGAVLEGPFAVERVLAIGGSTEVALFSGALLEPLTVARVLTVGGSTEVDALEALGAVTGGAPLAGGWALAGFAGSPDVEALGARAKEAPFAAEWALAEFAGSPDVEALGARVPALALVVFAGWPMVLAARTGPLDGLEASTWTGAVVPVLAAVAEPLAASRDVLGGTTEVAALWVRAPLPMTFAATRALATFGGTTEDPAGVRAPLPRTVEPPTARGLAALEGASPVEGAKPMPAEPPSVPVVPLTAAFAVPGGTTEFAAVVPPLMAPAEPLAAAPIFVVLQGSTEVADPAFGTPDGPRAGPLVATLPPGCTGSPELKAKPVDAPPPPWAEPAFGATPSGTRRGLAWSGVHAGATIGAAYAPA